MKISTVKVRRVRVSRSASLAAKAQWSMAF